MSLAATAEHPISPLPPPQSHQEGALCRICNVPSSACLSLFEQQIIAGKNTTLAKDLMYCTGLAILEEEHFLPQHICPACLVKLETSLQFKQSALRMDRLLRQRHLDLSPGKSNKPARDPLPEAEIGEEVSEEYILVLDEREQQQLELKMEKSEINQKVIEVKTSRDTDPPDEKLEEQQQLEHQTEEEELAKNWIEITEDGQEAVVFEEGDLYEIVEEPEEQPPIVIDSDHPKQPKTAMSGSPRRKTQNPTLQCQICGKQLSTSNSFKYHMQLHGTATPYACQICGESFKTRNAYEGHVTLHDPNNPNRCSTCGKVYRQASSLRSHLLTHSGIKPFECTICGKRLTQRSGYKKHMLTHTGEKPHACDICGRSFRYSSNLIAHKRSHSQEKPHQCQVCHKRSFGSTSELNRHMLVHSSERNFACSECGKTFKRQASLGLHEQSHKTGGQNRWGKVVVVQPEEDHPES